MKLEINHKKLKIHKDIEVNNILLNNEWTNNDNKEEIKRYVKTNKNENTTIQNPWNTAKAILRGKFKTLRAYHRKQEKSQNKSNNTFKGP